MGTLHTRHLPRKICTARDPAPCTRVRGEKVGARVRGRRLRAGIAIVRVLLCSIMNGSLQIFGSLKMFAARAITTARTHSNGRSNESSQPNLLQLTLFCCSALVPANSVFLSHHSSNSLQLPARQQCFSLTELLQQSPAPAQRTWTLFHGVLSKSAF